MKRLFFAIILFFICNFCFAETYNINWFVDGSSYTQTTCNAGDDIILPTTPTKRGYTFVGWKTYTPIEYLESTGTQWINTKIKPTNRTKTIIVVDRPVPPVRGLSWELLRTYGSSCTGSYTIFESTNAGNQKYIAATYGSQTASTVYTINSQYIKSRIVFDAGVLTIDNGAISINTSTAGQIFGTNCDAYLFANPRNTSFVNVKIYSAQFYEGDVLVRDFIPVLDATGIPCMYDRVLGEFFYNAGTGDFIAGPIL